MALIQWNIFDFCCKKKHEGKREIDRVHEYSTGRFTFHGSLKMKWKAWSKTWREVKWSRTKHLETAKNSSLKVLSITTGEQGPFTWSLPGNITVINVCYLNNCLFCHERTSMWLCNTFSRTWYFYLCVFLVWWLHVCSNTCNVIAVIWALSHSVNSFLYI